MRRGRRIALISLLLLVLALGAFLMHPLVRFTASLYLERFEKAESVYLAAIRGSERLDGAAREQLKRYVDQAADTYYNGGSSFDEAVGLLSPLSQTRLPQEDIAPALDASAEELSMIMASFEAKELSDIQPMDEDEEIFQDPGVYDAINFLVADLKAEDKVICHCARKGEGERAEISLRFTSDGIRVVCDTCGACKDIHARSASAAEEYMSLDLLELR